MRVTLAVTVVALMLTVGAAARQLAPPQGAQQPQTPVITVPGATPKVNPAEVPTQKAVAVKEVESPAAPSHASDQVIWALMVSLTMQYLKKAPWFGLLSDATSSRAKSVIGLGAALLTAAGIHLAVSGSVFDGGGASITVTGISLNAFKDIMWQWASQQAWYRAVVKEPREVAVVRDPTPPARA